MNVYTCFAFFALGVTVVTPILVATSLCFAWFGPDRSCLPWCGYLTDHLWGVGGGLLWGTGTVWNWLAGSTPLISGERLGFAASYAFGNSAPLVAILWGLLWFREFSYTLWIAISLGLTIFFFALAITFISLSGRYLVTPGSNSSSFDSFSSYSSVLHYF